MQGPYPGVLTVLSGMTYMEHLQDNIRTHLFAAGTLTPAEFNCWRMRRSCSPNTHRALHRMSVLPHALSYVGSTCSGDLRPLQPLRERRQRSQDRRDPLTGHPGGRSSSGMTIRFPNFGRQPLRGCDRCIVSRCPDRSDQNSQQLRRT